MNLQQLPLWAWIALAAIAYMIAKKKGWLDKPPTGPTAAPPASPRASGDASPAAQLVRIEHVVAASPAPGSDPPPNPLTQTRRVNVGLDVAVTPVSDKPTG